MSGYPNPPPGHGYGYSAPPTANPYGGPPTANPYAGPPISNSYSAPPPAQHYSANPYGGPPPSHGQSSPYDQYAAPHSTSSGHGKPPQDYSHSCGGVYQPSSTPPYGSPFASLVPSVFPPGTDPNVIACFQLADQDGSGMIDDKEMQRALSSYNQSFSLRTVHLLMHHFTSANAKKIGPKEFTALFYSLQNWRAIFERFDMDRSGRIDLPELRDALLSLGFAVSPAVLDLLVSKFDKSGGQSKAIEYDNFIECCLTVKGCIEKEKQNGGLKAVGGAAERFCLITVVSK
ncbi:probable calcium-binding protein CML50 isoform X2 [Neltuma alba]|uniref:probable calcium-binding protein CML50 isoform X2 n=1 Tax=Neltuma alba TaxID=207710 RepID=UPI0010A31B3B|nr:probable calcium-binding protein CML50 isoform X2 [Prosopis alba]